MKQFTGVVVLLALVLGFMGCQQSATTEANNKKLTLEKPSDVTLKPGDTSQETVSIKRSGFRDPVTVTFENLPAGVTVQDMDQKIAAEASSAKFTLKAASDAKPTANQEARVIVKSGELKASEPFKVTIKDKS